MEELILKEREIKEKLIELVNSSELPAFVIREILQEMLSQILKLEQQQYELAKQQISKEETENVN